LICKKEPDACNALCLSDPLKDECFGGWFSQVMLEEFLGYEDILLSSLQQLAKQQNNSGQWRFLGATLESCKLFRVEWHLTGIQFICSFVHSLQAFI